MENRSGRYRRTKDKRYRFKGIGVPRVSDGQLLFLMNMVSKMKANSELGSRIASVHNGSSIFTGDAGSGESEIKKWIIENDWLEAIIALPESMFYNTEINTFIWIITNKKPEHRKGKVQLINAIEFYQQMIRSMGKKSYEFLDTHIKIITDTYLKFEENEISKIFSNDEFSHNQITVERPLRLTIQFTEDKIELFSELPDTRYLSSELKIISNYFGKEQYNDLNEFQKKFDLLCKTQSIKISPKDKKVITDFFSIRDETATAVIKKENKNIVDYVADPELRDIEKIPFGTDIDEYFENEVIPYAPDAWFDSKKNKKGYQIHFSRYFTEKKHLRKAHDVEEEFIKGEEKRLEYLKDLFISDPQFVGMINDLQFKLQHSSIIKNTITGHLSSSRDFKKSKNPWFDEIPKHWEEYRAKWIFKNFSLKGYPKEKLLSVTQGKGAIPRDEYENRVVMPLGELMSFKLIEAGDFVISLRSFQGGIEYSNYRGIISPAYTVLKNRMEIHKPYFKHLLKCDSFIQSLNTAITGIREGKNINYDDFADIILPFPPKEEQIEIAKLLDEKLPNIEKLIRIQDEQKLLFKEQKKVIVDEAVVGRINHAASQNVKANIEKSLSITE